MKKILVSFYENGQNGGPYISHQRILNSALKNQYNLAPFFYPRIRQLINPIEFFKLVKKVKDSNADAMLVAGLQWTGFLLSLICKFSGVKIILAVHGSLLELKCSKMRCVFYSLIEKLTIKMSSIVYGVSDYVSSWDCCKDCPHYYGTIYNMCEKKEDVSIDWRKRLGLNKDDIVVASTGRITKEKGFDVLWKSIQNIGHSSNIKYIVAGDGPYLKEWQTDVKNKQYDKEVFLLGYQKNVDSILNNADIFIICTKHETLCISLLEAAMHKLPLIATNVGGIPEIVDESCGFLSPINDADYFAKVIRYLSNNGLMRKKMGENAYLKMQKKFDNDEILKKINDVFSRVVN